MKVQTKSFFFKITGIVVVVLLVLFIANIIQTRIMMSNLFSEQQEKRGISVANMLASRAANLIIVNNYYDLHELMKDTQASSDDIRYAFVVNNSGDVLAHSFSGGFPDDLLSANLLGEAEKYHIALLSTEEGLIRDIAVPVFDGRVGIVHVGLSDASLREVLDKTTYQLLIDTMLAMLLGLGFAVFLARRLTKPIDELVGASNGIIAGDLTRRVKVTSDDEFGMLAATFNTMADHLYKLINELKQKEEARTHLLQKVIVAQEEERKRIARELHDQTGQTLTSLMMGLKCLADRCPDNHHLCQLDEMRAVVKQTLGDIHRLAVELRPSILDDMGLVAALEKYVYDYKESYQLDIGFHVDWRRLERLPHEIEVVGYRIVQEALTNVTKYAKACNISIILTCTEDELSIIIEDDGVGFQADKLMAESAGGNKLGLYGMRERALLAGGTFAIESSPALGTTIYLRIPLKGR